MYLIRLSILNPNEFTFALVTISLISDITQLAVALPTAPSPSKNRVSNWSVSILIAFNTPSTDARDLLMLINLGLVIEKILLFTNKESEINLIL